jgi:hypothetical protein
LIIQRFFARLGGPRLRRFTQVHAGKQGATDSCASAAAHLPLRHLSLPECMQRYFFPPKTVKRANTANGSADSIFDCFISRFAV